MKKDNIIWIVLFIALVIYMFVYTGKAVERCKAAGKNELQCTIELNR